MATLKIKKASDARYNKEISIADKQSYVRADQQAIVAADNPQHAKSMILLGNPDDPSYTTRGDSIARRVKKKRG